MDIQAAVKRWKALLLSIPVAVLQPAILFSAAGTLGWVMGWVYIGVGTIVWSCALPVLMHKSPDLIKERTSSLGRKDVKPWDRAILVTIFAAYVLTLVVAGMDHRLDWSPRLPIPLQLMASLILLLGLLLTVWAMFENRFFSAVVRIQKDRGHTVVTTGPYRFVRHPGYLGAVASQVAVPFTLDALWALVPVGVFVIGFIIRTALEDRTLIRGLEGYREYAGKVRYRLVRGVW